MAYRFNIFTGTLDVVGSSGSTPSNINAINALIDFGPANGLENDTANVVVSAPWVNNNTILTVSLGGPTADHDIDDASIENINLSIGNIIPGVSFEIVAHSENFTWGEYQVSVIGV